MGYLLDTHVLIWGGNGDETITPSVRSIMLDGQCFYSVASLWEIAIKQSQGKLDIDASISELDHAFRMAGFRRLHITPAHLDRIKALPDIHRDPFDRLLVAQAQEEDLTIVTCDRLIPQYPVSTVW